MKINDLRGGNNPERELKQIKELIGRLYSAWKKELLSAPRTRKELTDALESLKQHIRKQCGDHPIVDACIEQIENKFAEVFSMNLTLQNTIKEFIKPLKIQIRGKRPKGRHVAFKTYEELVEIPFVKEYTTLPGFKEFRLAFRGLVAVTDDNVYVVGYLENEIGVEQMKEFGGEEFGALFDKVRAKMDTQRPKPNNETPGAGANDPSKN